MGSEMCIRDRCEDNLSFSTKDDLSEILDRPNILSKREELSQKNFEIINSKYRWDIIIEKYEKYFLKILGNKKIRRNSISQ